MKWIGTLLDQVLNLRVFKNYRTSIIGATIALLGLWQGMASAGHVPPIQMEWYLPLNAILTERLAKFAKEHNEDE